MIEGGFIQIGYWRFRPEEVSHINTPDPDITYLYMRGTDEPIELNEEEWAKIEPIFDLNTIDLTDA